MLPNNTPLSPSISDFERKVYYAHLQQMGEIGDAAYEMYITGLTSARAQLRGRIASERADRMVAVREAK